MLDMDKTVPFEVLWGILSEDQKSRLGANPSEQDVVAFIETPPSETQQAFREAAVAHLIKSKQLQTDFFRAS